MSAEVPKLDSASGKLSVAATMQFLETDAATSTTMDCRAGYQPEEHYEQLRCPNSGPGPSAAAVVPAHVAAGLPIEEQAHLYGAAQKYYGQTAIVGAPGGYVVQGGPPYANSKLSADAQTFVPNQPTNVENQQHYQHQASAAMPCAQQQQQQQQHRMNGYNKQQSQHHQQQQHYNHHQQQQQQQQQPYMRQSGNSAQNRLRMGNGKQQMHGGAVGNFYQQPQQQVQVQPMPHQLHTHAQQQQQQQTKFHRHAHLNNSFQQISLQQQHQQQQYFNHQHHQQQPQPHASTSSAAAAASSSSNSSHPDMEQIALEYLDTVINCLNQNPGQFDSIASRFLTIFDGMEANQYVLSIAMEDIFEKSIEHPNFRYMGAKLYNLLHMLNPKPDSLFHTLLKCKLDFHQAEVIKYMQSKEQQQKVRETALFLAELYMQLRGDDEARIELIAENIVYSLIQLLDSESNENVRCICQTLKLAGYDLSTDCSQNMQEIISALQLIEAHSPGKYPMAASVIELQKNNWGRKVSNALGSDDDAAAKPPEPLRLSDEPVFYGPDGHELTAEETDFLAADTPGSDEDDGRGGDDMDLDPEMDEAAELAYKDFCKQQNNKT